MPSGHESVISKDSVDALRERVSGLRELVDSHDRRYKELRDADAKAITVALSEINRRLDEMNNFRGSLEDKNNTLATKDELQAELRTLRALAEELKDRLNRAEGQKTGVGVTWQAVLGVLGLLAAIAAVFWR